MRRRREKKTDYKQRLGLLRSGKPRLVIRRSLNYVRAQLIEYKKDGDITLIDVSSKNLLAYGWKGHLGNVPSAYLTGLLVGALGVKKGIREAIVDIGLSTSVKGSSLYALVKGARDAGLLIPVDKKVLPSDERIKGGHIAAFAELLDDPEKREKQFSSLMKRLEPTKLPDHFEDVKNKLIASMKVKK